MSQILPDRLYTKFHEWIQILPDGTALVGITDYAQNSLGDVTYVELPSAGSALSLEGVFGVVESVKAASDLYSPVTGTVLEINAELDATPELVNQDPYGAAWMLKVKLDDPSELDALLTPEAYAEETR